MIWTKARAARILASLVVTTICAGYPLLAQPAGHKIGRTPVTIVYEVVPPAGPKMHETHYYRSDGSYALSVLIEGDTQAPPTSVVDLAVKRNFIKDPATNLFDEFPLTQRSYDSHRHTALSCEATIRSQGSQTCDSIGDDEVLGYRVQKITTIVGGKRPGVLESLLAPALDFVALVHYDKREGKTRTVRRAISIKVGEPDESVFSLPYNYRKADDSSEFISAMEVSRGRGVPYTADSQQKFDQAQREKKLRDEIDQIP